MTKTVANLFFWIFVSAMALQAASCGTWDRGKPMAAAQVVAVLKRLEGANLSNEQERQVDEIASTFNVRIIAARKKIGKSANRISDFRHKAAEQGKRGKDLENAGFEGATAKEKADYLEFQLAIYDFRKAVAECLMPEQRKQSGLVYGSDGNWKLIPKQQE